MNERYVARAYAGKGWRVFNRRTQRPWGIYFPNYPETLLAELNGQKRPDKIAELTKKSMKG